MTPTEDLLLELLIARTRLGHTLWTVSRNRTTSRAAKALEAKGMVGIKGGWTEGTFLLWLTDEAITEHMSNEYVPPIMGGPR